MHGIQQAMRSAASRPDLRFSELPQRGYPLRPISSRPAASALRASRNSRGRRRVRHPFPTAQVSPTLAAEDRWRGKVFSSASLPRSHPSGQSNSISAVLRSAGCGGGAGVIELWASATTDASTNNCEYFAPARRAENRSLGRWSRLTLLPRAGVPGGPYAYRQRIVQHAAESPVRSPAVPLP